MKLEKETERLQQDNVNLKGELEKWWVQCFPSLSFFYIAIVLLLLKSFTLVFIKVDISEIYISFVCFFFSAKQKKKTKDIYNSYTSTFLKTRVYLSGFGKRYLQKFQVRLKRLTLEVNKKQLKVAS